MKTWSLRLQGSSKSPGRSLQAVQFGNSVLDNRCELLHFFGTVARSPEAIADLLRRKLGQQSTHPFGVGAWNIVTDPALAFAPIIFRRYHKTPRGMIGRVEIDRCRRRLGDKSLMAERIQITLAGLLGKRTASRAERCAQVRDHVDNRLARFAFHFVNAVVHVFQIPVVDQRHHHA